MSNIVFSELRSQVQASGSSNVEEIVNYIDTVIAAAATKDTSIQQGEIEHILDFLTSKDAPTRLRKMAYTDALRLSKQWVERMKKKAGGVVETEADTKILKNYRSSGMKWVKLVGEAAFKREGALMSHCVANYFGKENTHIYSLRDSEGTPHCTIEVQGDKLESVNQIKGKGNGPIHPKYIKHVLDILLKKFKLPIRDSELSNLGYILDSEIMGMMDKDGIEYQFALIQGKKYLYKYTALKYPKGYAAP